MKKNIPEWLKTTLILVAFLSVVVVWGSTTVITFIEYNTVVAIISVVSYFAVFIGIFGIEMYTNKYKFKYLILGKKYKEKVQKFMVELDKFNKKERKAYIKSMKAEYRRTGNVYFSVYYLFETPNKVWSDDNRSFVYYNALDWQKAEYLIYLLNFNCETGGGFNRFFEGVAEEPFTFEEIEKIVKSSDLFSKELKKLVLKPKHKKVFECFQNEDNLTDEDWKFLEDFENAIKEAALQTGAKKVFIEEEPKVAAIGAGLDISKPTGSMVIDIGGGTTDIAVLSLGGIVNSISIKTAGNAFDNQIMKYIKNKYKLLIGLVCFRGWADTGNIHHTQKAEYECLHKSGKQIKINTQ